VLVTFFIKARKSLMRFMIRLFFTAELFQTLTPRFQEKRLGDVQEQGA